MAMRERLLDHLWKEVINAHWHDKALDNILAHPGVLKSTSIRQAAGELPQGAGFPQAYRC